MAAQIPRAEHAWWMDGHLASRSRQMRATMLERVLFFVVVPWDM